MEQKMALPPQQFCVRWNSYHTNLQAVFPRLLLTEQFADVTLACESRQLRCHKLVLSACSAYLERLLLNNPCKHPIVLMRDMRFSEMQALVDFMYKGEVNVTQEELPSLLKSAEALQIRGLCSSDSSGLASELSKPERDSKDYTVATEALVAHAQREATTNGPPSAPLPPASNGPLSGKKRSASEAAVKEETVEEDGLYYGELDHDNMEYNEDEESGKPGSSLGQPSDFPIANVQCQYDSPDDRPEQTDHTYDTRDEPPAFIIHQVDYTKEAGPNTLPLPSSRNTTTIPPLGRHAPAPLVDVSTAKLGFPAVNVIHVGENNINRQQQQQTHQTEYININKRIRRSEVVLRQAADCVSRGLTFQTVSHQFNIPISTIRFFMARKGILPQRRRGRSTVPPRPCSSPEPPYHMQHYKLPDMVALRDSENSNE